MQSGPEEIMSRNKHGKDFPLGEARGIVKDLLRPNPAIYWADFLFHNTLGWGAFLFALKAQALSFQQIFFYIVSSLALFRAVIFIHELAHRKKGTFKVFRWFWNILCGFPLMLPSFLYQGVHNDHHKQNLYGTKDDGEYWTFALERPYKIVLYVLLSFLLPFIFSIRFIILTPLSYFHAGLRSLVLERVSSLAIDLSYRRSKSFLRTIHAWQVLESLTSLYGITIVALVIMGKLPLAVCILWYFVTVFLFLLNSLRTLAAHCYRNPGDNVMDFLGQYLDSVNVPGNIFLTSLWAPVGLRYHATHHLFPDMPYHALGKAHKRLMEQLSENTLYKETIRPSLWAALGQLWREASLKKNEVYPTFPN